MVHIKKGELAQQEKELLEVIGKGTVQEAGTLLANKDVRVNCLDENGMTPLMHAAYKGKLDMCKLLLRHGADVNCHQHEHGYTALMFAALSGNKDITWVMLEAGAETDVVNSVGRTAAQMAAFVGQHDCVTIINNFFPRERLDYYTKPQGLDKEPKLPPKLTGPLHKIITTTNLHPVKIVMLVNENPLLADEAALNKCYKVLDLICEKCMKQRDMNEVLAMKMHYISCIFQKCINFLKDGENKLDMLIRSLLKGRATDGFPTYQEKIIRESIRKFPYCEATLLQQLVRSIAPVEIGSEPTAFSVLHQAITGQVGFVDVEFCTTCGEKGASKRCSVCKMMANVISILIVSTKSHHVLRPEPRKTVPLQGIVRKGRRHLGGVRLERNVHRMGLRVHWRRRSKGHQVFLTRTGSWAHVTVTMPPSLPRDICMAL
ncbi:ankyrin repeat and MYND domain-containing protein 2 isoform X2 [Echinops telfairi]|uniref:Ankyrin repeat and MYND domain-containing protein 2 isoform X2 n=1 Tax=Echinops telfairi TaxID=9371 RepID=A0AC55CYY8_ECHTE|nr:ankyrin repeat and MYND domain-containing protein 2 isoform X2 [Echinops telfairi]